MMQYEFVPSAYTREKQFDVNENMFFVQNVKRSVTHPCGTPLVISKRLRGLEPENKTADNLIQNIYHHFQPDSSCGAKIKIIPYLQEQYFFDCPPCFPNELIFFSVFVPAVLDMQQWYDMWLENRNSQSDKSTVTPTTSAVEKKNIIMPTDYPELQVSRLALS